MRIGSILAIYALFWTLTVFVVMPFHVRTSEELGEPVQPGHADSAPHSLPAARIALWTTLVSAAAFGLYYLNYVNGWITTNDIDWSR